MKVSSSAFFRAIRVGAFSAAIGGFVASNPALAQTITESFAGFSSTSGLTLNGNATMTTTGDGVVLQLTPDSTNKAGSAFTNTSANNQISANGFSTAFNFRLSNPGGITDQAGLVGADGFTFTLQTAGPTSLGSSGGSLGYSGIAHSVAVEFDTFQNGGDPSSNFLSLHTNGATTVSTLAVTPDFDNGTLWTAQIDYNPAASGGTLVVRVSDNGTLEATFTQTNLAISTFLTGSTVDVGFTAGTGSGFENQQIVDWAFSSSYVAGGISPIPEPATDAAFAGMLALMLAGATHLRPRCTRPTNI